MLKETWFFIKFSLFRQISIKANVGNIAMHFFFEITLFSENLRIFQYFKMLSKSDLLELNKIDAWHNEDLN